MKSAAALAALLAAGCASATAPHATDADATRAALRWPGTTTADLEHGRDLYVGRCSGCHVPPTPSDHAPDAWPDLVAEMKERSKIDDATEAAIVRYVVTMAER